MVKKSQKRKLQDTKVEEIVALPSKRSSDEPIPKKVKWINKQRVMVFASRGISFRDRHLMEDLKKLMPHHKPESKMERSKTLSVINEMCEMKNCNKAVMFEGRKKKDLYLWMSNVPSGPSVKFFVENIYTMAELKMTGNCLRGSRPLLSFDPTFEEKPHYSLLKEILSQIFSVPNHHPKSQPFFDHVYTFTILDNRIWFRNFQILSEDGALAEIGPRFVLNPVKIFSGSFGGVALWENPNYISPAKFRLQFKLSTKNRYMNRLQQKVHAEATKPKESYKFHPWHGDTREIAQNLMEVENAKNENCENEGKEVKNDDGEDIKEVKRVKKVGKMTIKKDGVKNGKIVKKKGVIVKKNRVNIRKKVGVNKKNAKNVKK
ncbi:ribosome biogenesis protein BRX1 homolog [Onthophagus taurus]|uniref:ribosome biogenesis protein BRX1 homolog n=1 Tax=Onthophagus taurus TaxID=166361 RepID=UPI0039BE5E28